MKTYYTHDNGGRPYKVVIDGKRVKIFDRIGYNSTDKVIYSENTVFDEIVEEIFIGKSPKTRRTEFSCGHGRKFDGNTILLRISEKEYIYVQGSIASFKPKVPIVKYVSEVGNSDVPYPYAVDEKGNYYLMGFSIILTKMDKEGKKDPNTYYTDRVNITRDKSIRCECKDVGQPHVKKFRNINTFYIGSQTYTLTTAMNPAADYDRLAKSFGNKKLYVRDGHGKRELNKEEYVSILKEWNKLMGFQLLRYKYLHKVKR
jgi:hypothetical protein